MLAVLLLTVVIALGSDATPFGVPGTDVVPPTAPDLAKTAHDAGLTSGMTWNQYHHLSVIENWITEICTKHPLLVTRHSLGLTHEKRLQTLVKISKQGGTNRKAVFLEGGIHGREWISPAMVTFFMNELIHNQDKYVDILDKFDIYAVPVVNPDGYQFSHDGKDKKDRDWKKTRVPNEGKDKPECIGTDPNRNWGYLWEKLLGAVSDDPCNENYRGKAPFDVPIVKQLKDFLENTKVPWTLYMSLHSYGQKVLLPYNDGTKPANFDDMLAKAKIFADGAKGTSGEFTCGNANELKDFATGTSTDWAVGLRNFTYGYDVMINKEEDKHELPKEKISAVGAELFNGFKLILAEIAKA